MRRMNRSKALRPVLATLAALILALPAAAADAPSIADRWAANPAEVFDSADVDLADLMWIARPLVVFADSPRDPAFIEQMQELLREELRLVERDVIVIADTDPSARSDLRQKLRPRGFMLVLIGKDGEVKERKPQPRTVRELSRSIDKMPMRSRDLREDGRG